MTITYTVRFIRLDAVGNSVYGATISELTEAQANEIAAELNSLPNYSAMTLRNCTEFCEDGAGATST